jgi:drug/metabolite transporter (DMT)-like permease
MGAATTMLAGGILVMIVAVVLGEPARFDAAGVSLRSVLALLYLTVFGSIVTFSAYLWLMRNTTAARASTYAYVNPVVAVLLGWAVAGEPVNARIVIAGVAIVGAVWLIVSHPVARTTGEHPLPRSRTRLPESGEGKRAA